MHVQFSNTQCINMEIINEYKEKKSSSYDGKNSKSVGIGSII